jgi:hypothetical protein
MRTTRPEKSCRTHHRRGEHQVSTTTPTQRRATLARKLAPAAAEDEPSPVPMAALTKTSPPKEKKARSLANLFARKVTIK